MSTHHGHHRSNHSRSRMHHSSSHYHSNHNRSRTSSNNNNNNLNNNHNSVSNSRIQSQIQATRPIKDSTSDWSEHCSSSGKVYYYNLRTGLSQWEVPAEFRQQRPASPESEISESSSIRQQQDKSPSSSASSHDSTRSDSISEDKPLLTPSLAQYFRPELITNFNSSRIEDLERQANQCSKEALALSEQILKESVDLKIAKSIVQFVDTTIEAQEKKYSVLRSTIDNFGFP